VAAGALIAAGAVYRARERPHCLALARRLRFAFATAAATAPLLVSLVTASCSSASTDLALHTYES
jgi:hypothetical protein